MNVSAPPGSLRPEPPADSVPEVEVSRTRALFGRIADILLGKIVTLVLAALAFGVAFATFIILARGAAAAVAFHAPCTLQHGQRVRGAIESGLAELGFDVRVAAAEAHLCCGSAGTYSVLHPELAYPLRDRKLANLAAVGPQVIASANIGCIQHLQSGTATPVRHWVELVDDALAESR